MNPSSNAAPQVWTRDSFVVSDDPARIEPASVHAFLASSYWAAGIPLETVQRSLANSLCCGLYDSRRVGSQQIGLARMITDRATFAYLCDVYVLPEYRGQGLGKWMMQCCMSHPDLQGLRRFNLVTRDAHSLYVPLGFCAVAHPDRYMEKLDPDVYKRAVSA
jgi:ribosomal protein S18 acetylase RimI-like enzyme